MSDNYNNCSIVPFPFNMYKHPFLYITELHKISFLSQNLSKSQMQKWTPVLLNKIWYYKMHQESSQVIPE